MIGHLLGAAGAVENIITVKAIENQVAPPTASYTEPDPECDLDYVALAPRPIDDGFALSVAFAFGGHNSALLLAREKPW
jgi:3-oxoacyl-[acyl-carrier-protein] synthase II